jgi:hypothetical protein
MTLLHSMSWILHYQDRRGRGKTWPVLRSREAALEQACSLLLHAYSVQRITGPGGEEINRADIDAFYAQRKKIENVFDR